MSREKQIEEMAKILLADCEGACTDCEYYEQYDGSVCIPMRMANVLYHAGYRKQSEGLWRVSGDMFKAYFCSECGYSVDHSHQKTQFCPNCGAKMKGGAE